jgi:parallel beta-helix repeat protein
VVVVQVFEPFDFFRVLADDVRIERFEISSVEAGIFVRANGAEIQNNKIGGSFHGMLISGDGHRVRNNIIRGGVIGLGLGGVNGVEISGNRVSSGPFGCGICASNVDQTSPGTVIHHNLVSGALDTGIWINAADGGTIRNNTVRGTLAGCPDCIGIRVSGTTGVTIMHNVIRGHGVGIGVQDATNCAVGFNSVAFNNGSGINLSAIEGCLIERNYATRNNPPDCVWDGLGANTFSRNACATEDPPGAWD